MARSVDLNSDLGESFGAWSMGDDAALLRVVSSANVACGFHAGDASTMLATCREAAANGVTVGAHVSYRDLAGFGRRAMDVPAAELRDEVLYQLSALAGLARVAGSGVRYVKPHGALYNRIVTDDTQAGAVVDAVAAFDPSLALLGLADSAVERAARDAGLRFVREAFVDRGYRADGTLVPRTAPGALLSGDAEIAARAVRMATEGRVLAADGSDIAVTVDSLCVHGDTPGAVAMAQAVREALARAGIAVEPFVTRRILPYGDRALLVELDELEAVLALYAGLAATRPDGVVDLVPAARTIAVMVDPRILPLNVAIGWVERAEPLPSGADESAAVELPVRYNGEDLAEVARLTGRTESEVVAFHTGRAWRVAFGGFAPGFAYLAPDGDPLDVPRRSTPRTSVPAGAVGLAGAFSGVYPRSSPGGWQLIGTTDAVLWDEAADPPALLRPGTVVRFRGVR